MRKIYIFIILAILFSSLQAQITKQNAKDIVLSTIVGDSSNHVNVYMEPTMLSETYYFLSPYDSILSPFDNYWFFFIDDHPESPWGHSCRYAFINEAGNYHIVTKDLPPFQGKIRFDEVLISSEVTFSQNIDNLLNNTCQVRPYCDVNNGKYAVLFTGGDPWGSFNTFWTSLSNMYCTLIEHGFKKENIYVLSADGQDNYYSNKKWQFI